MFIGDIVELQVFSMYACAIEIVKKLVVNGHTRGFLNVWDDDATTPLRKDFFEDFHMRALF